MTTLGFSICAELNRRVLTLKLEQMGLKFIRCANDRAEALREACGAAVPFDLVLTDVCFNLSRPPTPSTPPIGPRAVLLG